MMATRGRERERERARESKRERERERAPWVVMVMRDSGVSEVTPQIRQAAGKDICVCVCVCVCSLV